MAKRSRLKNKMQRKSRYTFLFSVLGIILILFLLFRYGIPLLSDASFLFSKATSTPDVSEEDKSDEYIPVPRLDAIPSATNEKEFLIEGSTLSGLNVEIYMNGEKDGTSKTDENGFFEYKLSLTDGDNIIKARAVKGENKGEFTNSKTITLKEEGPDLTIDFPNNDAEIKDPNPVEIRGTTDTGSSVTVNEFQAIIKSDGKWSYFLTLTNGDNEIKVVSIGPAGNETEETIRVKYSP